LRDDENGKIPQHSERDRKIIRRRLKHVRKSKPWGKKRNSGTRNAAEVARKKILTPKTDEQKEKKEAQDPAAGKSIRGNTETGKQDSGPSLFKGPRRTKASPKAAERPWRAAPSTKTWTRCAKARAYDAPQGRGTFEGV